MIVIKQVIWDCITHLRINLGEWLWYTRAPYASYALRLVRYRFEYGLDNIFRLETPKTVLYYLAFDQ